MCYTRIFWLTKSEKPSNNSRNSCKNTKYELFDTEECPIRNDTSSYAIAKPSLNVLADLKLFQYVNTFFLEANKMKVLRKIVAKTKIDRIRSQQIRESCGIRPTNEWVKRRKREWDQH